MDSLPIFYSFRRCPYAMRARLAILASGQQVELREVVLRDKPPEMIKASSKATVPVLVLSNTEVVDESRDVMAWALERNDPEGWLDFSTEALEDMQRLIDEADGPFKNALDRYKYENRYDGVVAYEQRDLALPFIKKIDQMLRNRPFLYGDHFSLADAALLPLIRQFAHVDKQWFWTQDFPNLISWLDGFLSSERFVTIMKKYPKWSVGDDAVLFGGITEGKKSRY